MPNADHADETKLRRIRATYNLALNGFGLNLMKALIVPGYLPNCLKKSKVVGTIGKVGKVGKVTYTCSERVSIFCSANHRSVSGTAEVYQVTESAIVRKNVQGMPRTSSCFTIPGPCTKQLVLSSERTFVTIFAANFDGPRNDVYFHVWSSTAVGFSGAYFPLCLDVSQLRALRKVDGKRALGGTER